jgi:competence protein ComEC
MLLKIIDKLDLKLAQEWPSFSIWFVLSFAFGLLWFLHLECIDQKGLFFAFTCAFICVVSVKKRIRHLALFGLSLSAGFILGSIWGVLRCKADLDPPARTYSWIESTATIESIRPASLGKRKDVVLASLKLDEFKSSFSLMRYGRVAIYFSGNDLEGLLPGDCISFKAKAIKPGGRLLPGGYDFSLQGALNKIDLYGYATSPPLVIDKNASKGLKHLIMTVRRQYYKSIKERLLGDVADFASALIIGESRGLSKALMSDMRCAGISHVLCPARGLGKLCL